MNLSKQPVRLHSRLLSVFVLAALALPMFIAPAEAHDYDAVAKRLKQAVKEGELTRHHAAVMLATLKKALADDAGKAAVAAMKRNWDDGGMASKPLDGRWTDGKRIIEILGNTFASWEGNSSKSRITGRVEFDGNRYTSHLPKGGTHSGHFKVHHNVLYTWDEVSGEKKEIEKFKLVDKPAYLLRALNCKGKPQKKKSVEKKPAPSEAQTLERLGNWAQSTGDRIRDAAMAGEMSEKDAWKTWFAFKERELGPKLREMVKAGKVSEASARSFWKALELAETGERIEAAVARGDMTEKEAKAKWAEISREAGKDKAAGQK